MSTKHLVSMLVPFVLSLFVGTTEAGAQDFRALQETRPPDPLANAPRAADRNLTTEVRVLLAGDSWAQYMWDDGSHNDILDRYGHADKRLLSESLQSDPGPGYTGSEYAVSGSEARQWVDVANYPWIANLVTALESNPTVETVVLSIDGNDVLAGRSEGGWYKDMDLDVPGSEAALFETIRQNTFTIIDAILGVRPDLHIVVSSYDYPNFNVGFWCFVYACPKRRDLSRDPDTDLITDEELNAMMVMVEEMRIDWVNTSPNLVYDNATGAMHHYYGDGQSPPGALPLGGHEPPDYAPFPGGNPLIPTLRDNFRRPGGIDADPIHLDYEGYQYKITNHTNAYFFPLFRGTPDATMLADGGDRDGWTDGTTISTAEVAIGDTGAGSYHGILSFDTAAIPAGAEVTGASLYLMRHGAAGSNPFVTGDLGIPIVDIARGGFGAPELEPGDAFAPADATDAGAVIGSAVGDGYALRIDIAAAALDAIEPAGLTQFRIHFPGTDAGLDAVYFRDGDGGATGGDYPALAEYMGSSAPFLDVTYEEAAGVAATTAPPAPVRLHQNLPNPFRASTSIQFSVAEASDVRLDIYDVGGRHLRTLLDDRLIRGTHNRVWDGRTARGTQAPAGVYFARLRAAGTTESIRMVLLDP